MSFESFAGELPTASGGWIDWLGRWIETSRPNLNQTPTNRPVEEELANNFNEQEEMTPELIEEMDNAINQRFKPKPKPIISAVIGEPDFLPFKNLSLGQKLGAAVCRITKPFGREKSSDFIEKVKEFDEKIRTSERANKEANNLGLTRKDIAVLLPVKVENNSAIEEFIQEDSISTIKPEEIEELFFDICATGFLVSRKCMLTNYHVFKEDISDVQNSLETVDLSNKRYTAEFSYEVDSFGRSIESIKYPIKEIILYDKDLDYALVKLGNQGEIFEENSGSNAQKLKPIPAGDLFGWIQLLEDTQVIAPALDEKLEKLLLEKRLQEKMADQGDANQAQLEEQEKKILRALKRRGREGDPVNIIQHPRGRRKEIVLSNNRLRKMSLNYLQYTADIDFSSSGSPVFNQQWQLVGLHQSALRSQNNPQSNDEPFFLIELEQGVRTCRIVEDIRSKISELATSKANNTQAEKRVRDQKLMELWSFFNGFVDTQKSIDLDTINVSAESIVKYLIEADEIQRTPASSPKLEVQPAYPLEESSSYLGIDNVIGSVIRLPGSVLGRIGFSSKE